MNKGDMGDCNNYRGISLLNIVGKLFAKSVLMKLRVLAERIYPESQYGCRTKRATIDMIFSLRKLQEKCSELWKLLTLPLLTWPRHSTWWADGLLKIPVKIGCPPTLLSIVKSFHDNMKGTVLYDGATSDPFNILSGVKSKAVSLPLHCLESFLPLS